MIAVLKEYMDSVYSVYEPVEEFSEWVPVEDPVSEEILLLTTKAPPKEEVYSEALQAFFIHKGGH